MVKRTVNSYSLLIKRSNNLLASQSDAGSIIYIGYLLFRLYKKVKTFFFQVGFNPYKKSPCFGFIKNERHWKLLTLFEGDFILIYHSFTVYSVGPATVNTESTGCTLSNSLSCSKLFSLFYNNSLCNSQKSPRQYTDRKSKTY